MRAIITKTLAHTTTKPMRIVAHDSNGHRVTIGSAEIGHYGFAQEEAHKIAANKLKKKMGWLGKMACGGTKEGFVFVFVERHQSK